MQLCPFLICTKQKSSALKLLAEITSKKDFEFAIQVFEKVVEYQVTDFESISLIYKNLLMEIPELLPIKLSSSVPVVATVNADVSKYDEMLVVGGQGGCHGYN